MATLSNTGGGTRHLASGGQGQAADPLTLAAARRRVATTTVVALVGAALLGALFFTEQHNPRLPISGFVYLLAIPLLVALVHAGFSLAFELSWPRARGQARRARLRARGMEDMLGRALIVVHAVAVLMFAAIVALGAALSSDGETFAWGWNERSGEFLGVVTNTTFPGERVALPLALVVIVLLAVTWLSALLALRRPDVVTTARAQDLALRRATAGRVIRVTTAALLVTNGGLTSLAGAAVSTAFRDTWIGNIGTGTAVLGLAIAASAVLLAIPLPRRVGRMRRRGAGDEAPRG